MIKPSKNREFSISEYHNVDEVYSRIDRLIKQPIRPIRRDEMEGLSEDLSKNMLPQNR